MASSHMPARSRVVTGRRALLTLLVAGGVAFSPLPAAAAPETPSNSQEAAALVGARAHDLEVVTERFNEARVQADAQRAAAEKAAADVAAADAAVGAAREQVAQVARSAYTGDQLTTVQAMLTSSSADELLDRVGTLSTIADHNNGLLGTAVAAGQAATEAKAVADRAAADATAQLDRVSAQQSDLQKQIAEYRAQYDRLSAEEQARARALAEQHVAAADQAGDREVPRASRGSRGAPAAAPSVPVVAGSGAAATAVATAMAQLGDPYVWAASGPNSFDCSGLMQFAYKAAGVNLPHSSRSQSTMGQSVSLSALQPGDLVFFYSPVSHVGMYIGNGQMVHASTSGEPVKVGSINSMGTPPTAARRLAG
jgi:cell wall-associated NlpC family hydrolase